MHVDWIVEFTHGCFTLVDAGDVSDYTMTNVEISNRAMMGDDRTGVHIFSPRHGRFANLGIDVIYDRPSINFDEWDHVVELSLCTLSGGLEVSSICGTLVYGRVSREQIPSNLDLEPDIYQCYVLFGNLAVMAKRLREANESNYSDLFYGTSNVPKPETLAGYDYYRIVLWPLKAKVIKHFKDESFDG
jgi:hypothetical protein